MSKAVTFSAGLYVPEFLRFEQNELHALFHILRDPLATHVYGLLVAHSDFKTGEFLGGYHRLIELCTPPQPERGARRPGPTYKQLRRIVGDLVSVALVQRNAATNEAQGQLKLKLTPRERISTPEPLAGRVQGRVIKALNLGSMRVVASPMDDLGQGSGQGYQGGINTSISPQNPSYPQAATPQVKKPAPAEVKAFRAKLAQINQIGRDKTINSPPQGGRKSPHGAGQVAAARLMP